MTFGMHVVEVSLYLLGLFYSHFLVQLKMHFINGSFIKESGLWSYNKNERRPVFLLFTSVHFKQILG
jgi:hypothetical protein